MKLHLGCGKRYLEGFIHIDLDDHDHINYKSSIEKLPFIEDESVDVIYSCGVLEYFDNLEVKDVLKECHRVLKKNGKLLTSVPNFESIVKVYLTEKNIYSEGILGPLYGRIVIKNNLNTKVLYHKTVYDFHSLKSTLEKSDFYDIKLFDPFEIFPDDYDDYSKAFFPFKDRNGIQIHLNIESKKK